MTLHRRLFTAHSRLVIGIAAGLLLGAVPAAAAGTAAGWTPPACETVDGDGSFSFTRNDGATLTPTSNPLTPVAYSSLVALARPGHLVGITKKTVQLSQDAGCSWEVVARTEQDLSQYSLAAGPGGVAYAYGVNDPVVLRISGRHVSRHRGPLSDDGVAGFHVDASNPNLLTAVDKSGGVYLSTDGSRAWVKQASAPVTELGVYEAAIDPWDRRHIVLGLSGAGTLATFDGGWTWTRSEGIGAKGNANVFSVSVSSADPGTVWVEGFDPAQSGSNRARHIWRSSDGGLTYRSVLDGWDVTLYNGTELWPSPVDPDVVYFEFGTSFAGFGTDLYRYDDATGSVSWTHNAYDGINSVSFHPADPAVMYLGLVEER